MIGVFPESGTDAAPDCASCVSKHSVDVRKPDVDLAAPQRRRRRRGWEPTLTQLAERANLLWQQDGCPDGSEVGYWVRAREQLKAERAALAEAEDFPVRAAAGLSAPGRS
jgi:hypothetical protein